MTRFVTQSVAVVFAVVIAFSSLAAITSVPATHAVVVAAPVLA